MHTFLFTDIEGSTRLWARAPVAMAAAVQRQETLLREVIGCHHGEVFKTVGDGLYAVFAQPEHAVEAAVAAQLALLAEQWPGLEPDTGLSVRMALHTGPAEARDRDYFGPTLNRLSRTLAAGHGGQILCTDATLSACGANWPAGISVRDLGQRTLRDVPGSGRIFQVVAPGVPEHFPPLTTLDPRVHNLPHWPTQLIGRDEEQAQLLTLLRASEGQLVTVLGTGGVGKTRLASEVAAQVLDEFQDGIRFVDLSALRDDAQVLPAIIQVTGAADQLLDPREALLDWLQERQLLLVLDNCEQVVDGVAAIASDILHVAPGIVILATSRIPIRIRSERQIPVEPLPTSAGEIAANPAMQLFAERARDISERFTLDPESTAAIAQICRLVDGLPLAIELAAAWVRVLSPKALHRRLQDNRTILRDGPRDLPSRQRTLAATIAWSYDLLESDDQRAFRRLAVFRGGIAVDAAAAVIWDPPVDDPLWALSRLDALVQANLLQVSPDSTGEPRFVMLQTIQEFATEILRQSGEWDEVAAAHAEFFAKLAKEADDHYFADDVGTWFDRLDLDLENFRAAIEHFSRLTGPETPGLEMAVALWDFLDQRGHEEEARTWITLLLKDDVTIDARLRARALLLLGNSWFAHYEQAEAFYIRARAAALESRDERLIHAVEGSLGLVALPQGQFERALSILRSVAELQRQSGDADRIAHALMHLSHACCQAGNYVQALDIVDELEALRPDPTRLSFGELVRGRALRRSGEIDRAIDALQRARAGFAAINARFNVALSLYEISSALNDRELNEVHRCISAANDLLSKDADAIAIESALVCNARLLVMEGEFELAARVLGSARHWRASTGTIFSAYDQNERNLLEERIREVIGDECYQASAAAGALQSMRAVFERARSALDSSSLPAAEPAPIT